MKPVRNKSANFYVKILKYWSINGVKAWIHCSMASHPGQLSLQPSVGRKM